MATDIPDLMSTTDVPEWGDAADVIVVGFGVAGACAAIAAAETGADVLLVERATASGGTTALCAGQIYLGGGTPVQEATGIIDDVAEMIRYIEAVTPEPDSEKIRLYCEGSVAHFSWLESLGVPFERSFYAGKAVYQPGTEGLMWTGNELTWPFREQAKPAPRGHKVAAPGETGGAELMRILTKHIESLPIRVQYETTVRNLVADEDGHVAGVHVRRLSDGPAFLRAGSVVLAAGGFVVNTEMIAAYTPRLASGFMPLGTPGDDGLGIRLGQSAGGVPIHMEGAFMTAAFYPPPQMLNGIIVNEAGHRFVAEDSYHGRTAGAVLAQPNARAYLILDAETTAWPEIPLAPFIDGWESIDEMELALGIPPGNLATTLDDYNASAAKGDDPDFHKHPDWLKPLDAGPWAAFDLSLGKASYVGFTLGGLRTSPDGEVLTAGGPVPGLYAAGACASNIAQDCSGYASGTCVGEGSFFGRRAGRHAAASVRVG
ncbi:FAD-binding protein [Hoyosella altamirensis]|uniref:Succinate dehydrogenase/fumarate reductase flavoprotein subunit n=1 Tax=Hoyosella altamirensis TaxID=616997 RepID=A0A839RS61_9ACTN|nr:FAD-binding protein [Hoyosella altamirensis]MBB3039169.1 succinate dehydrogenase/fumarate reductase flavoprotein subunit [Hoyosella altamirensis]